MNDDVSTFSQLHMACQEFCRFLREYRKETYEKGPVRAKSYQLVVYHRFFRAIETFLSITSICAEGFFNDAISLARALVESAISLQWLMRNPEENFRLYQDHLAIKRWEILKMFETQGLPPGAEDDPKKTEEIENEFRRVQEKYPPKGKTRKGKPNYKPSPIPNVAAMAGQVGRERLYNMIYRDLSSSLHGDLWSFVRGTTPLPNGGFDTSPKVATGIDALMTGISSFFEIYDIFQREFNELGRSEFREWVVRFEALFESLGLGQHP